MSSALQGVDAGGHVDPRPSLVDWLTVERVLYGAVTWVALTVRLVGLGWMPLHPSEAMQALPALAAAQGQPYELTGISPLLFSLQRASFMLLGSDEVVARWWTALFGGLACLLFYALRDRLTRGGALAAAALWAASPIAVFNARSALGDSLTPALALALLASINLYAREVGVRRGAFGSAAGVAPPRRSAALVAAAVAFGLLLTAGSGAYTVILIGLAAALWWRSEWTTFWADLRETRRGVAIGALAAIFFGSTFLGLSPAGLAAAADLLGGWLRDIGSVATETTSWEIVRRLLISEPLLLGFAIGGFVRAGRRRDRFGLFAGLAALIAVLSAVLPAGRQTTDLGLVVMALALLAGPAIAATLRPISSWRGQLDPWVLLLLELILIAIAAQSLPGALHPTNKADWVQLYTTLGILTASMAGLLWLVYGAFGSWRTVAEVLPVVLLIVGSVWGASQLTALSFDRGVGRQSGALAVAPDAGGLADLHATLRELASLKGDGGGEAPVDLVLPLVHSRTVAPVLRWELRELPNLRVFTSLPPDRAPLVITVADKAAAPGETYGGAAYSVLQRWRPETLSDAASWVRWLLYRETAGQPERQQIVLWVDRAEPADGSRGSR
jgi:4-amino-4-deoxy-L-arabinose transferase-like glycosyltransferase